MATPDIKAKAKRQSVLSNIYTQITKYLDDWCDTNRTVRIFVNQNISLDNLPSHICQLVNWNCITEDVSLWHTGGVSALSTHLDIWFQSVFMFNCVNVCTTWSTLSGCWRQKPKSLRKWRSEISTEIRSIKLKIPPHRLGSRQSAHRPEKLPLATCLQWRV